MVDAHTAHAADHANDPAPGGAASTKTLAAGDEAVDMMAANHRKMLWPHYLSLMLGVWLVTGPYTLGYLSAFTPSAHLLAVTADRGLPSFELRNLMMT